MVNQKVRFKNKQELDEAILNEKAVGTPDIEIGQKYGVTFRYIEKLVTKSQGINISSLNNFKKIKNLYPEDFKEEKTTVWSFKKRGNWATHSGEYRGNWSPFIPRNIILKYSKSNELVLDYFCGAGTTAVECKLLGRRCIALDINDKAIDLTKKNLDFSKAPLQLKLIEQNKSMEFYEPELLVGDARNLSFLEDNSIDLICAHPPYANILQYTDIEKSDLSFLDINEFLKEISNVAKESFRVLKPGRQCAILIGDTRRKKHVIPLGFELIDVYLNAGFELKELIIKRQHNCKTTGFWYANSIKYNFLLLAHEYLPIFEKSKKNTKSNPLRIKEKENYNQPIPALKEPRLKSKLDGLETTTVWVLPEKSFEKQLNKNVIDRYSKNLDYLTINFTNNSENEKHPFKKSVKNNLGLLFIKSEFLNNDTYNSNINFYLGEIKNIVVKELPSIANKGFIVIQTKDIRIGEYIEPVAKKILDILSLDNIWLKEIIIATNENQNSAIQNSNKYLKIVHQYLLVYEKR